MYFEKPLKCFLLLAVSFSYSQIALVQSSNWTLQDNHIVWHAHNHQGESYKDNIEMAGRKVAGIISYDVDTSGMVKIDRKIIYPQLHPHVKDSDPWWAKYRAYLTKDYNDYIIPALYLNQQELTLPPVDSIVINGTLKIYHMANDYGLQVSRDFYPSMESRAFVEKWTLHNSSDTILIIDTEPLHQSSGSQGGKGHFKTMINADIKKRIELEVGEAYSFHIVMSAHLGSEDMSDLRYDRAHQQREHFINEMSNSLILNTPDQELNTLFRFSKIRASESIYDSKLGLIHSPGGGRYYVGIWANDQAEYINPFFSYLGYDKGHQSSMNCYRAFANEINDEYNMLPYAFEVEEFRPPSMLDRGDAAMIAYGASQYALATGDREKAKELWPLIEWCLEYCKRQLNDEGVVSSQSDEMEGRIETGDANLSTSSLYYGGLDHAIMLGAELNISKSQLEDYNADLKSLAHNIETYFGARINDLDTYKYYKEHEVLRHWICMPLVVGINDRKEGTIRALFDNLWEENGVLVEKDHPNPSISKTFWDRGTLYAFRGAFIAGEKEQSIKRLKEFSAIRLLGERVPYVVEAYPEGSMAHLSAESALYCRIFIEGMFGIKPTGLNSFSLTPRLPVDWDHMSLKHIKAFEGDFDVDIIRESDSTLSIKVYSYKNEKSIYNSTIKEGDTVHIIL